MNTISLSIVIPIHDKITYLPFFVEAVEHAVHTVNMQKNYRVIEYEILFVTNEPSNRLHEEETALSLASSIQLYKEESKTTAATLTAKGIASAKYDTIATLDIALQNPSKILADLIKKMHNTYDLVAIVQPQAGATIFAKQVWDVTRYTSSRQNFIKTLSRRAREAGFVTKSFQRKRPKTVINTMQALLAIQKVHPQFIPPPDEHSMKDAGVGYKRRKYITHTTLNHTESALESFINKQILFLILTGGVALFGLLFQPILILQILVALLSTAYLSDVIFNLYLLLKTLRTSGEITASETELESIQEATLPIYTILCPLFKEAHILPQFIRAIRELNWPKDKLDVCLLLESNDVETLLAVEKMQLPPWIRTIIVPDSFPKTKPKACNYGLSYAKGEYVVIYDAEDIPDPLQLKKAYIGFLKSPRNIACLQAKLSYYNINQNLLTRFFTAEYDLWFDITLEGLHAINTGIPLGGTSNHFRTADLKKLNAWDPFNVTEDADLGIRLFKEGYQTAILDSVTLEEANSNVRNWLRQRSRWIKGYMQTYLVHTRTMLPFIRKRGIHAFIFHLIIGGKLSFIFINPLLWITTISYFILPAVFGPVIEIFYPTPVLYIAIASLIFGNSLYLFNYIMGCVKKEHWSLIKYIYLIPLYWGLISIAGYIAFYQLLFKPHYWEKTIHGLHLTEQFSMSFPRTRESRR